MSFHKSGRGFRGRGGGEWSRPSRGSFGGRKGYDQVLPESVITLGYYVNSCQDVFVLKVEIEDVPCFNASIYLENKECIGKIDEIFGNLRDYYVTVKPNDNVKATSFKKNQRLYINPTKLLPLKMFLPQPQGGNRGGQEGRGGGSRRGFGGRGVVRGRVRGFSGRCGDFKRGRGRGGGGGRELGRDDGCRFRGGDRRDGGRFKKSFGGGFKY